MNRDKLDSYSMALKQVSDIVGSAVMALEEEGYHIDIDLDALDNKTHTFFKLYLLLWGVKDGKRIERWMDIDLNDYMMYLGYPQSDGIISHLLNLDNWKVRVGG